MLEKLHAEYGRLMIQLEILQAQIQQIKQQIAVEMNKAQIPTQADKPKE